MGLGGCSAAASAAGGEGKVDNGGTDMSVMWHSKVRRAYYVRRLAVIGGHQQEWICAGLSREAG